MCFTGRRLAKLWWTLLAFASAAWAQPQAPDWAGEMLQAHNAIRTGSRLPPLVWSTKVAALAQQWADTLLERNQFEHRPKLSYGENLFAIDGARWPPTLVVREWAAEARNYDYATNRCQGMCGHYTQIVWRDTKALGCGLARSSRREIWVCDYDPPGNWVGKRPF